MNHRRDLKNIWSYPLYPHSHFINKITRIALRAHPALEGDT